MSSTVPSCAQQPTPGDIPKPVRELLATVLGALDIPHPATVGDTEAHNRLLNDRVMHAVIALRSVLDSKPLMSIEWTTAYLHEQLAEHPPTGYRHYGTPRTTNRGRA